MQGRYIESLACHLNGTWYSNTEDGQCVKSSSDGGGDSSSGSEGDGGSSGQTDTARVLDRAADGGPCWWEHYSHEYSRLMRMCTALCVYMYS